MTPTGTQTRNAILTGLGLVVLHVLLIVTTWDSVGFVKDEGYYFSASRDNFRWYLDLFADPLPDGTIRALTPQGIDRRWNNNHEHPPFCKTVMGLNHYLWHDVLKLVKYGNSHRMGTLLWTSLLVFFLYWYARTLLGSGWAMGSVLLFLTMPRVFFHNHMATFDMPVVAVWFVTVLAFRKALTSPGWAVVTAFLFGIGLATKNNAYFLPVVFGLLYIFTPHWSALLSDLKHPLRTLRALSALDWGLLSGSFLFPVVLALWQPEQRGWAVFIAVVLLAVVLIYTSLRRNRVLPLRWALILLPMLLGPLTFFLSWPWIWHDTLPRMAEYLNRHLHPPAWETYYLGDLILNPPPFPIHYPFVMWWYTLPVSVVFLGLLGFAVLLWRTRFGRSLQRFFHKASGLRDESPSLEASSAASATTPSRLDNLLLIVNIVVPLAIIANPKTPVYGGTKHFMTAVPYLSIACIIALRLVAERLSRMEFFTERAFTAKFLAPTFITLAVLPGIFGMLICGGNGLSYYNEIMGGPQRSPEVGMQRSFWAAGTRLVLPELNKIEDRNLRVYYNNTPYDSQQAYKRVGELREDFHPAQDEWSADAAVLNTWQFKWEGIYEVRRTLGADAPTATGALLGVPLVEVYVGKNKNIPRGKAITLPYQLLPSETYR